MLHLKKKSYTYLVLPYLYQIVEESLILHGVELPLFLHYLPLKKLVRANQLIMYYKLVPLKNSSRPANIKSLYSYID